MATTRCPRAAGCPLPALFHMQSSLVVWQARYCDSRWEQCARYVLAKSGMRVPARLLPSGHELGELPAAEGP